MTEQFDAEQWLRELNHVYEEADWVADELAAAKARIEGLQAVYGAAVHQIDAEQAMSRKLYEALQCVDLTSGEVNPQVVIEAIAEYEKEGK